MMYCNSLQKDLTNWRMVSIIKIEIPGYSLAIPTLTDPNVGFVFGTHNEMSMLKLLSVSTKIVQILRQGLLTFNCMRFSTLTDYITIMIK